jgi:Zn-dependent protease
MKWTWKIGRISGIDIKLHLSFFFLLIWVGVPVLISGGSISDMLMEIVMILLLFVCVVLHELGHALTAKMFGTQTKDITLLPIGGVARMDEMPEDPKEEFLVAASGPAVNLVIGGAILVSLLISGFFTLPLDISTLSENFWVQLMTTNFTLVAFNLIPAFPMDGGRVLRAILGSRMDRVKATRIAANVGRVLAVVMGIAGLFVNSWLILIAIFIWFGAGSEAKSEDLKAGLEGLVARDAMISQFYKVEANLPLASVYQVSMQTGQRDIPVKSNGHYLGIIRRQDLLSAIQRLGDRAPAYAAIGIEPEGLSPDMPLLDVLPRFSVSQVQPVIEDGALIGLVTPESIQQRVWLNRRAQKNDRKPPEEKTDTV